MVKKFIELLRQLFRGERICPACKVTVDGHGDARHESSCPNVKEWNYGRDCNF
jgi:hypothetical protein